MSAFFGIEWGYCTVPAFQAQGKPPARFVYWSLLASFVASKCLSPWALMCWRRDSGCLTTIRVQTSMSCTSIWSRMSLLSLACTRWSSVWSQMICQRPPALRCIAVSRMGRCNVLLESSHEQGFWTSFYRRHQLQLPLRLIVSLCLEWNCPLFVAWSQFGILPPDAYSKGTFTDDRWWGKLQIRDAAMQVTT